MYDIAIIGCGISGASVAYNLARYKLSVVIVEKENDVATGTTKANSAIVHAGYDPAPGTLMAKFNVEGNKLIPKLCKEMTVPFIQNGSMVLAFDDNDVQTLHKLLERGQTNGVEGLRILTGEEARAMEPNLSSEVKAALYAPTGGIVDPWELAIAMASVAVRNGVKLMRSAPVTDIKAIDGGYALQTPQGEVQAKIVVNAAGTHADEIHNMIAKPFFSITPSKGEYQLLDKNQGSLVKHTIFQCPTKVGKGILAAPTVHGNLITGPTADDTDDPDDVTTTAQGLAVVEQFAHKSVPCISFRERIRAFSGVRAHADVDDFIIDFAPDAPGFFNLAAIKSPGLTAAPAIGAHVAELLAALLKATPNPDFDGTRKKTVFKHLSKEEKKALVAQNSSFGRIICRCEGITEGEILEAIHSPIPPVSIDGVKRRCNTGMGRCQGGFCGPRVHEILCRELGCPMEEIVKDKAGSYILTGSTKIGGDQ